MERPVMSGGRGGHQMPNIPKLAILWLLASLVLAALVGTIVNRVMSSGGASYQATTMLGVIGRGSDTTAEGAQSAATQWAAVGTSPAFQEQISARTGLSMGDVAKNVAVSPVLDAPALNVTVKGNDRASVNNAAKNVATVLGQHSKSADPRYPLKSLTGVAVIDAPSGSGGMAGLGAGALVFIIGALLLAQRIRKIRRGGVNPSPVS